MSFPGYLRGFETTPHAVRMSFFRNKIFRQFRMKGLLTSNSGFVVFDWRLAGTRTIRMLRSSAERLLGGSLSAASFARARSLRRCESFSLRSRLLGITQVRSAPLNGSPLRRARDVRSLFFGVLSVARYCACAVPQEPGVWRKRVDSVIGDCK